MSVVVVSCLMLPTQPRKKTSCSSPKYTPFHFTDDTSPASSTSLAYLAVIARLYLHPYVLLGYHCKVLLYLTPSPACRLCPGISVPRSCTVGLCTRRGVEVPPSMYLVRVPPPSFFFLSCLSPPLILCPKLASLVLTQNPILLVLT